MHPQAKSDKTGGDQREHHGGITENPSPRICNHNGGNDAKGRNENDVDLRVAKEPKHVLVKQWVAALGGIDEMGADRAVVQQKKVLAIITAGMAKMIMND